MRRATAWSVRGVDRSTQEIAEEAARRAGVSLADWLDGVVAESAAEQGVATDDMEEDDKLDAIGERLSRLSTHGEGGAPRRRGEERPRDSRSETRPPLEKASPEEARIARDRLDAAMARFESRATKNEERTAKAFESVATWIERSQADRLEERETLQTVAEKLDAIESRARREEAQAREAAAARKSAREQELESRLDARLDALARRVAASERPPARAPARRPETIPSASLPPDPPVPEVAAPAAVESDVEARLAELTRRVAAAERDRIEPSPPAERPRLDVREAVEQIARRRVESAPRSPPRPEESAPPPRGGWRNFGVDVEPSRPRAQEPAPRPAPPEPARPSVDRLREEMAALETRLAKLRATGSDRRPAAADAAELKAGLASMARSVADIAPRNASVALEGAVDDLGQRLTAAREAGASESLVAPIEAMVRQVLEALRERDPRAAASALEREIRGLGAKIDTLAGARVDPELLERIRRQSEEVRSLLAAAAKSPVPVERLERQIGQLADRVERIASSPSPRAEIVQILRLLSETHAQIEQSTPAAVLQAIERRLEQLTARVDEAVRRPAPAMDWRPLEELARRVESLRATIERRPDGRVDFAPLETALREINAKLDRTPDGAADSQALMQTLQSMNARLEETFRQPRVASIDPRPIEDLARRIDSVRASVKNDFAPHAAKLEAALGELGAKLDRAPDGAADSKALAAALRGVSAKLEETLRQPRVASVDPKPIEDLARRIESVRSTVERKADFTPHAAKLEAALAELGAKLDRAPDGAGDSKALAAAFQGMSAKLEETLRQPRVASVDPKPIEDLARRIEGVRATVERKADFAPHAAKLEAALGELGAKLERAPDGAADSKALATALQGIGARLEEMLRQPRVASVDPRPIEDLARRIESVRTSVERGSGFAPHAAKLEAALGDLSAKLDRPAQASIDAGALMTTLQGMSARLEESFRQPRVGGVDSLPIEDLARRIESVRATVDSKPDFAPHAARLEAALGDLSAKLDRAPAAEPTGLNTTLRDLGAKLEEAFRRPPAAIIDSKPLEDLGRRIDDVLATVERHADRSRDPSELQAALREIGAKLDRQSAAPIALDPEPLEDLARRIESIRTTIARQADRVGEVSEVKAALREIGAKLDLQAASTPSFDVGMLEEFARRIDDVREAVERRDDRGQDASELKSALDAISAKLDRPAAPAVSLEAGPWDDLTRRLDEMRATLERSADPRPDEPELRTALREIGEKLDRQAQSTPRFDVGMLEEFARRIDDVREAVERRVDGGQDASELKSALDAISAKLDRQAAPAVSLEGGPWDDLTRRLDEMRATLERSADPRPDDSELRAALREIGEKLDRQAESTRRLDPWAIDDIVRRIDDVRATLEHRVDRGSDNPELAAMLRDIGDKLDRRPASPAELDPRPLDDLARRIDEVREALERQAEHRPDSSRLDEALREISVKLDRHAISGEESRLLLESIRDLAARVEVGATPSLDPAMLERFSRDPGERPAAFDTGPLESRLRDLGDRISAIPSASLDIEPIERMLAQVDAKLDEVARSTADARPLELAIRDLQDRLTNLPEPVLDASLIEHAAEMLARRLEKQGATALDAEALVNQISDIHSRLDSFDVAASSNAALERAVTELIEELETTRQVVKASSAQPNALAPLIGGVSELRAERAISDRRMESRLSSVQGILEKLADRLARVEDAADGDDAADPRPGPSASFVAAAAPAASRAASAAVKDADLRDIPDRDVMEAARPSASASTRPLPANDFLLEPGAGAPARNAAINAHIAAARRAAQTAMAEQAAKEQAAAQPAAGATPRPRTVGPTFGHARDMFVKHRRPILLGATAAALTVAATVAVVELRGGHHKELQKSELTPPTPAPPPASPIAESPAKPPAGLDDRPTGAIAASPPKPAASPAAAVKPAPEDLIAALPAALPTALRDAAAAGDAGAETELALRYLEGRSVARDAKLASRWFELSATQGLPIAEYRLAALYEKGNGVARDLALAREWYRKAAKAGNARAMHNLAVLLAQDGGAGKPDYAQAAEWFRQAAELGIRDSQFNLGVLTGRGLGVPQNLTSSWLWFSLASRQGDSDAAKKRDEVAAKMDATALASAEKALAEFKTKTPDPLANEAPAPAGGWDAKPSPPQASRRAPSATRS
jgi:localization factor PodJL